MADFDSLFGLKPIYKFTEDPIDEERLRWLRSSMNEAIIESNMSLQMVDSKPAFFEGSDTVTNGNTYIALIGQKSPYLYEKAGYWGTAIRHMAISMGIDSCYVTKGYKLFGSDTKCGGKEKRVGYIVFGWRQYTPEELAKFEAGEALEEPERKTKEVSQVSAVAEGVDPAVVELFNGCVNAALYAPTAGEAQNFKFTLEGVNAVGEAKIRCEIPGDKPSKEDKMSMGVAEYYFACAAKQYGMKFYWTHDTKVGRSAAAATHDRFPN